MRSRARARTVVRRSRTGRRRDLQDGRPRRNGVWWRGDTALRGVLGLRAARWRSRHLSGTATGRTALPRSRVPAAGSVRWRNLDVRRVQRRTLRIPLCLARRLRVARVPISPGGLLRCLRRACRVRRLRGHRRPARGDPHGALTAERRRRHRRPESAGHRASGRCPEEAAAIPSTITARRQRPNVYGPGSRLSRRPRRLMLSTDRQPARCRPTGRTA